MSKGVVLGGYQISNALIAIGAVLIILAGAYTNFSVDTSSTDQKQGLDVSIQQEEVQPGDTIRVKASFNEEPAEDADIFANGEQVGKTNQNGISGYSVPESLEGNLTLRAQYQGEETTLEASFEDGNLQVPTQDDSDDTGDSQDDQQDGTQDDSDNQDNQDSQDDQQDGTQDNQQDNQDDQDGTQDDQEDGTQDTENETYDNEPGFQLQNDPVANELNSLELYLDNGAPAENTNVYINNNQIGTTTSSGTLTFTVPNTQKITLSTDAEIDSETFEVEGYTNETDSSDSEDPQILDAYYQYTPENPTAGTQIEFDASSTTGENIQSYNWSLGNGQTATGQTVTQTYDSAGTYTVELEVTDGEGNTDTIDADVTVDEQAEPDLILRKPDDGSEHTSTELQYNLTLYNGLSDSTYRIITNRNTVKTAQLGQSGTVDITPTVTVPDGEFTTTAEIDQGGQTYTSGTKTVTAGVTNTPDIQLVSPADGGSVSTFDSQTEVTFEYQVNDKGWAESADLVVNDQIQAETQLYSQESTQTETVTLDSGNTYNWQVTYEGSQQGATNTRTLDVVQEEPDATVNLNSPTGGETINDYQVTFDYLISSDVNGQFTAEIVADEDMNRTWMQCDGNGNLQEETISYSEGDMIDTLEISVAGGQTIDNTFDQTLNIAGDYRWGGEIVADSDDSVIGSSGPTAFTTSDQPPEDESGDCGGGSGGT